MPPTPDHRPQPGEQVGQAMRSHHDEHPIQLHASHAEWALEGSVPLAHAHGGTEVAGLQG